MNVSRFLLFLLLNGAITKFSKSTNPSPQNGAENLATDSLRSGRMRYVWEKASGRLKDDQSRKIFWTDLRVLDADWMEGKHSLKDDHIPMHEYVNKKLRDLLKRHDAEDVWESLQHLKLSDDKADLTNRNLTHTETEAAKLRKFVFKDEKLNKLWRRALTAGFNDGELVKLRRELLHYQQNENEFYDKLKNENQFSEFADAKESNHVTDDVDDLDEDTFKEAIGEKLVIREPVTDLPTQRHLKESNRDLKEKFQEITSNINDKLIKEAEKAEFQSDRARKLWEFAQSSVNFDDDELKHLKQELRHFDGAVNKLGLLQSAAEESELELKKFGKDPVHHYSDHVERMTRVKQLNQKVSGDLEYFREKVGIPSHVEL